MRQTLQNNLHESHKLIVYSAVSVNNSGESGRNRKWPNVDNGQNDFKESLIIASIWMILFKRRLGMNRLTTYTKIKFSSQIILLRDPWGIPSNESQVSK